MSSNISQRKMRDRVLIERLSAYASMQLAIDCGTRRCGGLRTYSIRSMLNPGVDERTVGQVLLRLRCRECEQSPQEVTLRSWPGEKRQELRLVGPGAYG